MILKTYTRVFTDDMDPCLRSLEALVGEPADLRFALGEGELAVVGDFLVVAGPEEQLQPLRGFVGPVVVDDLEATTALLLAVGATVAHPTVTSETGSGSYLRHPGGTCVEYVQWTPEIVERLITRRGTATG